MKRKSYYKSILALVLIIMGSSTMKLRAETNNAPQKGHCHKAQKEMKPCSEQTDSSASCTFEGVITKEEVQGLQYMYQEEKMARDVYAYLYDKYGMRVFGNITESEAMHMSAVAGLMEGARITNRCSGEAGEFSITEIQELYNQLIRKGDLSIKDALEVGVLIEETDIRDLEKEIATASNESIKQVYTNLLVASTRHLQAFHRNLDRR